MAAVRNNLCTYGISQGALDFKTRVRDKINEIMRLVFLQAKDRLDQKFGCFEIYSFDFVLDAADLHPILVDIDINPSLALDTQA